MKKRSQPFHISCPWCCIYGKKESGGDEAPLAIDSVFGRRVPVALFEFILSSIYLNGSCIALPTQLHPQIKQRARKVGQKFTWSLTSIIMKKVAIYEEFKEGIVLLCSLHLTQLSNNSKHYDFKLKSFHFYKGRAMLGMIRLFRWINIKDVMTWIFN